MENQHNRNDFKWLTWLLLWIPLWGLWIAIFYYRRFKQQESYQYAFVLHSLWVIYFLTSNIFLLFFDWIVPYFLGPLSKILWHVNLVVSIVIIAQLTVLGLWGKHHIAKGFQSIPFLTKAKILFFPISH